MQQEGQTMGGNGVGYYLPITMIAFHDTTVSASGTIASGGTVLDLTNPAGSALNSSYRIQCATLVIKDASGNEVYNKTAFQGTSNKQVRRRAIPGQIPMWMDEFFGDYGTGLTPNETYYFSLTGTTFPGESKTVIKNQSFTYTPAS